MPCPLNKGQLFTKHRLSRRDFTTGCSNASELLFEQEMWIAQEEFWIPRIPESLNEVEEGRQVGEDGLKGENQGLIASVWVDYSLIGTYQN